MKNKIFREYIFPKMAFSRSGGTRRRETPHEQESNMPLSGKYTFGKISILFGIYGIPESILVNDELTVIKKIVGPINQIQFEDILKICLIE